MPKIPRIITPSVQQGSAPTPYMNEDVGAIGRAVQGFGNALDDVTNLIAREKQRADERELGEKQNQAEQEWNRQETGYDDPAAAMMPGGQTRVDGWGDMQGGRARGITDGNDSYEGVLPQYDKTTSRIADTIKSRALRERFLQWAADNRLQVEMRARKHEDAEGVRELREQTDARRESLLAKTVGMASEPRLQQDTLNKGLDDLENKWVAADYDPEWIANEREVILSQVRAQSMDALLTAEHVGLARDYFDTYGHQIRGADRTRTRMALERKEGKTEVATDALRIFDMLDLGENHITAAQRTLKAREIRKLYEEDPDKARLVEAEVDAFIEQHERVQAQLDDENFLAGTRYLAANGTLKGFDYGRLPENDKLRLETMERDRKAANLKNPVSKKASAVMRHAIEADPAFLEDPLGTLNKYADKLTDEDFRGLLNDVEDLRAGKPAKSLYTDKQWLVGAVRETFGVTRKKVKADVDVIDQYRGIFDELDRRIAALPGDRDALTADERLLLLSDMSRVGLLGGGWFRDPERKHVMLMTEEEKKDARITDDELAAAFAGEVSTMIDGEMQTIPTSEGVRLTTETWLRNSDPTGALGEIEPEDVDRALFQAFNGGNDDLLQVVLKHYRQGTVLVPQEIDGMSNEDYLSQMQGGLGESARETFITDQAIGTAVKFMGGLGPIPEDAAQVIDQAILQLGDAGVIDPKTVTQSQRMLMYLDDRVETLVAERGISRLDAMLELGLPRGAAERLADMPPIDYFGIAKGRQEALDAYLLKQEADRKKAEEEEERRKQQEAEMELYSQPGMS